jgi:hypothetical protein
MQKLALVLTIALVAAVPATSALAVPKDIPPGSKLVYKWNMIGYPAGQEYTGGCGQGNRLFVNREANKAQVLITNGARWDVTDCNATADNRGEITTSQAAVYDVYVRILGKPGGHIFICADTYEDFLAGETLCLLGTIDLTRGKGQSRFQLAPASMFDASLYDIMWTVDTNSDFRLCQFRVYERPAN